MSHKACPKVIRKVIFSVRIENEDKFKNFIKDKIEGVYKQYLLGNRSMNRSYFCEYVWDTFFNYKNVNGTNERCLENYPLGIGIITTLKEYSEIDSTFHYEQIAL